MMKNKNLINVIGAKEHNLKNINVSIPKETLTVITGPSGSGKSSLAFDVLYTEGKRRYVESLSSYARQFLGVSKKPAVDKIEGLCPAISIDQKTVGANPRSTVGTITEIYDYLRVLFARIGTPHCSMCNTEIKQESPEGITNLLLANFNNKNVLVCAPLAVEKKGEFVKDIQHAFEQGYTRFYIDGNLIKITSEEQIKALKLAKTKRHTIDVVLDSLHIAAEDSVRIQEALEKAFSLAKGTCKIIHDGVEHTYSMHRICLHCTQSIPELEPRLFSFNSPIGACPTCHGLGGFHDWSYSQRSAEWADSEYNSYSYETPFRVCKTCNGKRLKREALSVYIGGKTIFDVAELAIADLIKFLHDVRLDEAKKTISRELIKEIITRLNFLDKVGLSYLSLNRTARTLSGGESQRIRLATQIGSALSGVLYILDEPSIGLHQRDNDRLIETLKTLRDQGNTVVVIEHDLDTVATADYIIEVGPGAGIHGGKIVAIGTPAAIKKNKDSLTGAYLTGKKNIEIPASIRPAQGTLKLSNAHKHNLKNITVEIPLGVFCAVSGVSGSGKSTLIFEELIPALSKAIYGFKNFTMSTGEALLEGGHQVKNMVVIDQSPIGRTSRSNPATYLGIFDDIRTLFASLPESKIRGYKVGRFSFNVQEGRCFECNGDGTIKVSMHFLPDVVMICKVCKGKRYNAKTLEIIYKGKSIADILQMTALEALEFFESYQPIAKRLKLMCEVGLEYLTLGQPSTTLSGGEAQRIKLVHELAKRGAQTTYILDEPTTGLHNEDIKKLLMVLNRLVDKGNSMIVIEHNLDVLKTADYIIDLGPEGGNAGGYIVATGTPQQVSLSKNSLTGKYLQRFFK